MTVTVALPKPGAGRDAPAADRQDARILVVVPTLGQRPETLGRTLASIRQQSGVLVDIVVVAKHQTPALKDMAAAAGAALIVHPGHISAAVNAGFEQANEQHQYAAWLGDDDLLRDGALESASMLFGRNPQAVVVYGSCDYIDIHGALLFNRNPPPQAPTLLQFVPGLIKQEACLFRLSALRKTGGLDETLRFTMDLDILLKLHRLGPFVRSDRVHAAFCWHSGSLTIANRAVSLAEAQGVQGRHAQGLARLLYPLWRHAMRYLILAASWQINRKTAQQSGSAGA